MQFKIMFYIYFQLKYACFWRQNHKSLSPKPMLLLIKSIGFIKQNNYFHRKSYNIQHDSCCVTSRKYLFFNLIL